MKRLIMLVMAGVVTLALGACDKAPSKQVAPAATPAPEAQTQADNGNDVVQVAAADVDAAAGDTNGVSSQDDMSGDSSLQSQPASDMEKPE